MTDLSKIPYFSLKPLNPSEQPPPHPGSVLIYLLLSKGISIKDFSENIKVRKIVIELTCAEKRSITIQQAFKFGKAFNMDYNYWLNLQRAYDVYNMRLKMQYKLNKIETYN